MKRQEKIERIHEILASQSTLTLATADAKGTPRSTPLFYIADQDLRLYWFSSPRSPHSRNNARCAKAAISIHAPTDRWREILGLQATGSVSIVGDPEQRRALTHQYRERFQLGALFAAALRSHTLYCFEPDWIRVTDNSVRFGYRFEISFGK
jgi:uncharacterized protein YhbP (UPF0306 family)